jgi:methylenetetrahydrofolate reductase (NADPH)
MKVIEFLEKANKTLFSFEIIPPTRGGSIDRIFNLVETLMPFDPPFIDLTSRSAEVYYEDAGEGKMIRYIRRKRPGTIGISAAIKNKFNVETVPHILCRGFTREETEDALIELNYLGIIMYWPFVVMNYAKMPLTHRGKRDIGMHLIWLNKLQI